MCFCGLSAWEASCIFVELDAIDAVMVYGSNTCSPFPPRSASAICLLHSQKYKIELRCEVKSFESSMPPPRGGRGLYAIVPDGMPVSRACEHDLPQHFVTLSTTHAAPNTSLENTEI